MYSLSSNTYSPDILYAHRRSDFQCVTISIPMWVEHFPSICADWLAFRVRRFLLGCRLKNTLDRGKSLQFWEGVWKAIFPFAFLWCLGKILESGLRNGRSLFKLSMYLFIKLQNTCKDFFGKSHTSMDVLPKIVCPAYTTQFFPVTRYSILCISLFPGQPWWANSSSAPSSPPHSPPARRGGGRETMIPLPSHKSPVSFLVLWTRG